MPDFGAHGIPHLDQRSNQRLYEIDTPSKNKSQKHTKRNSKAVK